MKDGSRRGRPPKEESERKSETIRIRVTKEDLDALLLKAGKDDKILSEWAREVLLEALDN